jgi:replicative DNA helicase
VITSTPPVGRTLPHDHEAEVSVLGALMLDPNAVAMVRDRLVPEDFYSERHGHIYRASLILADQGQPIDPLMLRSQLERNASSTSPSSAPASSPPRASSTGPTSSTSRRSSGG